METPSISHPTDRPNFTVVTTGSRTYWFSYRTCVGFLDSDTVRGIVVRRNEWGPTTGKHLNEIDGGDTEARARRVDLETFQALLSETAHDVAAVSLVSDSEVVDRIARLLSGRSWEASDLDNIAEMVREVRPNSIDEASGFLSFA